MKKHRFPAICRRLAVLTLALTALVLFAADAAAQEPVNTDGQFELGDGLDPLLPGAADILGSDQPGPDWNDLFNDDRTPRDDINELGNPGSNGVPDFLDAWGGSRSRRDIAFVVDAVGDAATAADLGNAYAYTLFNSDLELVLYAGVERLSVQSTDIILEFNRALLSIGTQGEIVGDRSVGDLQVRAVFSTGTLSSLQISRWEITDPETGTSDWQSLETLPISPEQPTEQCNPAGTTCVVCNASSIQGGSWDNFDPQGNLIAELPPSTFMELGINLGAILATDTYADYYRNRYTSFQVSTNEDSALATFLRAAKIARWGK